MKQEKGCAKKTFLSVEIKKSFQKKRFPILLEGENMFGIQES
jgi:hypothetical protein